MSGVPRRALLAAGATLPTIAWLPSQAAPPPGIQASLERQFGNQTVSPGKVTLNLPALSENGNSVALEVLVDSPMTAQDHVSDIYVFAEKNPLPDVAHYQLTAASGIARIATRIRLADSQTISAVAKMNNGTLWLGSAEIIVTLAACIDLS